MTARASRAIVASFVLFVMLLTSGVLSTRSIAGKTRVMPHTLAIYFTGDDWGSYKGSCG